jgi:hypothetical protein
VPALLSPEDDAALKFVLRSVSHGSHVQVLTTPMFDGARRESASRHILSGFLRTRTKSAVAGCDPEEFARHIASYLKAADEKRSTAQPRLMSPALLEYDAVAPVAAPAAAVPPPESPAEDEPMVQPITPIEAVDAVSASIVVQDDVIDLSAPVAAIDMTSEIDVPVEPVRLEVSAGDGRPRTPPATVDNDALDRLVSNLDLLFAAAHATPLRAPVGPAPVGPALVRDRVARADYDRGSAAPAPSLEQLAVEVDSRRRDLSAPVIERQEVEPRPAGAVELDPDPKPTGDEWGLFDAKHCGIEALLVKLREVR